MPAKIPKALSEGEETFQFHCTIYKLTPEREFLFAKEEGRRWRIDFAWPDKKIGAEIQGGTWQNGRHNRGSNMAKEYERMNHALLGGWKLFQFTTDQVQSGYAIDMIVTALG